MRRFIIQILLLLAFATAARADAAEALPLLDPGSLRDFDSLPGGRKAIIQAAFTTGREVAGMPYLFGGNGPQDGGFDCSGAIYYVLRKVGLQPPRTSSAQYLWVNEKSQFHEVAESVRNIDDPAFSALKPGDLIFWSGTYEATDDRTTSITHIAIFLGHETKDGHAVMINATNGRSYRGKVGNGFGVYDFRVPAKGRKSRIVGYGSPPGLETLDAPEAQKK